MALKFKVDTVICLDNVGMVSCIKPKGDTKYQQNTSLCLAQKLLSWRYSQLGLLRAASFVQ